MWINSPGQILSTKKSHLGGKCSTKYFFNTVHHDCWASTKLDFKWCGTNTLRELFFAGINFCGALIWDFLRNLVSQIFDLGKNYSRSLNYLTIILNIWKILRKLNFVGLGPNPQNLVPAKISSLKAVKNWNSYPGWLIFNGGLNLDILFQRFSQELIWPGHWDR